jgi:hypothetical protein
MKRSLLATLLTCLIVFALTGSTASVQAQTAAPETVFGPELVIYADSRPSTLHIPAPDLDPQRNSTAVQVTFLPAGTVDGIYTCQDFPAQAQAAYQYAVSIWGSFLTSAVPIRISACWTSMGTSVLGSSGPNLDPSFPNQPYSNTYYPFALADALAGADQFPSYFDIVSRFNSSFSGWYFGTDGATPSNKWDFSSVVLHEIGHGLGFSGSMRSNSGSLTYGSPPTIYDRFTQNAAGTPLLNLPNGGSELASALTGGAYFAGPYATAANGGSRIPLYTPSTWQQGSSYSHVAESFNGTANALMTFSLSNHEVVHNPGPVALCILADIGWQVSSCSLAPPSGLTAAMASASQINLAWIDNSSNETGFEIYRSTNNSTWSLAKTTLANETSYQSSGLTSGTRYDFRVRAVNAGGASAYSNTSSAITDGAPPAPSNLTAFAIGETKILLNWSDNSNVETGFEIQRSPNGSSGWVTIFTSPANATSYTNTGLVKNSTYYYQARAVYSPPSAFSAPASTTTWNATYLNYLPVIGR